MISDQSGTTCPSAVACSGAERADLPDLGSNASATCTLAPDSATRRNSSFLSLAGARTSTAVHGAIWPSLFLDAQTGLGL